MVKFEKEKKDFIKKFSDETEELALNWDELNRERELFEKYKESKINEITQALEKRKI